jgi:hypothetical protein
MRHRTMVEEFIFPVAKLLKEPAAECNQIYSRGVSCSADALAEDGAHGAGRAFVAHAGSAKVT